MRDLTTDHSCLALNTATLGHNLEGYGAGWSPEEVIDGCSSRGYGGIVFWVREVSDRAYEIGERVRSSGLSVVGLCRAPYLVGEDSGSDDEAKKVIDIASALGSPTLTVVTGGFDSGGLLETRKRLCERLSVLCAYAKSCGIRLALEPLHPVYGGYRTCLMTVRDALDVCDEVSADNLGIAVDSYHVWWDTTLGDILSSHRCMGKVLGYHVSDFLGFPPRDVLLDRGMMGDGVIDLRFIRSCVESSGYLDFIEVEIFSSLDWWLRPPDEVLDVVLERFRLHC